MKHSITELYKVHNAGRTFLATEEFVKNFNIPTTKAEIAQARTNNLPYALRALYHISSSDPVKVFCHPCIARTIYMFGEKTWFDGQDERDHYRRAYFDEKRALERRNKAKNQLMHYINTLTTEQIENLIEELGAD